MLYRVENITLTPDKHDDIINILNKRYQIKIVSLKIIKKSLDARNKRDINYKCTVIIELDKALSDDFLAGNVEVKPFNIPDKAIVTKFRSKIKINIVGSGPAGLFCALRAIEAGGEVEIFERGKPVEERSIDIKQLESLGMLNQESNILFGEGGAGTYSDGKLKTRTNRPEIEWIFNKLVEFGAPSEILYESKPHLGTDKLKVIIHNIRDFINKNGIIHFTKKVDKIITANSIMHSVLTSDNSEYYCKYLVLATGHSARDIYEMLYKANVCLEKKGFAIGVRIEHPSKLINDIQYGNSKYKNILPAADYNLTFKSDTGRGVYTFCMCPGGFVINSSSENGMLCVNGMSGSKRDSEYSNSAIVVTVHPDDTGIDVLDALKFQRDIEAAAYKSGGGKFYSPAQKITSFMNNKIDSALPHNSFRPGVNPCSVHSYMPAWICEDIKKALLSFEKKMKGFISSDGLLIGAETRTSSPIRIVRNNFSLHSVSVKNLFPAGEGSGYAGGIVSSAVDGVRVADKIIEMEMGEG